MSQSGVDNQDISRQYVNMRDVHQPNARMQAEIFVENNRSAWLRNLWMRPQHGLAVASDDPRPGPERLTAEVTAHPASSRQDARQSIPSANHEPARADGSSVQHIRRSAPPAVMIPPEEFEARRARALTAERHAYLIDSSESEDEDVDPATNHRVDTAAANLPAQLRAAQISGRANRDPAQPLALRFPGLPDIPAEAIQALISMLEEIRQQRMGQMQG